MQGTKKPSRQTLSQGRISSRYHLASSSNRAPLRHPQYEAPAAITVGIRCSLIRSIPPKEIATVRCKAPRCISPRRLTSRTDRGLSGKRENGYFFSSSLLYLTLYPFLQYLSRENFFLVVRKRFCNVLDIGLILCYI